MESEGTQSTVFQSCTIGVVLTGDVSGDVSITCPLHDAAGDTDQGRARELREDRDAHVYLLERAKRRDAWIVYGWGIASLWLMSKVIASAANVHLGGIDHAVLNLFASMVPVGVWLTLPLSVRRRHWERRRSIRAARRRLRIIEEQLLPIEARLRYRSKMAACCSH